MRIDRQLSIQWYAFYFYLLLNLKAKSSATLDTFSNLTNVNPADSSTTTTNYTLSENGIAWPGESKKYVTKPSGDISNLAPPPNWALRFPDGYNDSNIPDLKSDEHFQNWMRTAGLPTFTKLWARNDADTLQSGTYQIVAYMSTWLLFSPVLSDMAVY